MHGPLERKGAVMRGHCHHHRRHVRVSCHSVMLFLIALSSAPDRSEVVARSLLSAVDGKWINGTIPRTANLAPDPIATEGVQLMGNREKNVHQHGLNSEHTSVFLRHPWKHIFSQYLECKYSPWGKRVTQGVNFPGRIKSRPEAGFRKWLAFFMRPRELPNTRQNSYKSSRRVAINKLPTLPRLNCYDPWNMQARYLAPHHIGDRHGLVSGEKGKRPDLEEAVQTLNNDIEFLGITDLYPESLCLFHFYATGTMPPTCQCANVTLKTTYFTHGVPRHSLDAMRPDVVDMVYALAEVDALLYVEGLNKFRQQAKAAARATGIDLLCNGQVEALEHSVYELMKRGQQAKDLGERKEVLVHGGSSPPPGAESDVLSTRSGKRLEKS